MYNRHEFIRNYMIEHEVSYREAEQAYDEAVYDLVYAVEREEDV